MARTRMSETGDLRIPSDIRTSLGLTPGREVEVSQEGGRMIVAPVHSTTPAEAPGGRLTVEEFLVRRIPYDGPPMTDEMIEEAVLEEAGRRWDRLHRQWDKGADEDAVD